MEDYDLKIYISSHKHVLKKKHFRDSKLNLKECSIKPYVVLDGGDDVHDKNIHATKNRAEGRIKKAHALSVGRPRKVLPVLVKDVFKQILRKLEVPFVQCVAEAAWEAAALANEWNCPVLSNKTDFYFFDIKGGFLPLYRFQWNKLALVKKSDKKFIPAKVFSLDRLCTRLNLMSKHLLPVFATILSNHIDLDKGMLPSPKSSESNSIDGLLRWLSRFKVPEDAIHALLSHIKNPEDSGAVLKVLTQGLEGYRLTPSSIAQFFISGKPPPSPSPCLPEWALQHLAKGKLSTIIVDVLAEQRTILSFPVENFRQCSSNLTSRPIRQAIYGLLLSTRPGAEVEEYDRQGLKLTSSRVEAVLPSKTTPNLQLETLWKTPWHWRQQVFLDALCASQAPDRLLVPPSLQLAVYVTCYWLKHAQPEPRPEFFWALLVGLVYGELSRDPVTQRGAVPKRLKNLKSRGEQTPLDLEAAHAFSQWQGSLRDSICLNQLLANLVPEPEYAWLYEGVLLHGAVGELKKGVAPESLLAGVPQAPQLYQQLKEAVEHELDDEMRMRFGASSGRPSERPTLEGCAADLSDMFEQLMDREEEDDEDPQHRRRKSKGCHLDDRIYGQTCSIRTRLRSRTRKLYPREKKSEQSHWE
ncbi:single-strand DNA endonuclease ASTE1-like isoform X2 [Salminus brasiliensis]|uniref:single-strand DNA endonuclease ASTE1-like isoform X2 n=1 Tax=Salminus brasiliensis TaxID=930266 RepID=UPI003B833C4A